jgi:queuine tRNA-ribosyltransferase
MNMRNNCSDEIKIRRLRCPAHCGISGEERWQLQDLRIDATLELARSDNFVRQGIADTVDYTAVANAIFQTLNGQEFHLIETIAKLLCVEVLTKFPSVQRVTVAVHKKPEPWVNSLESFRAKTTLRRFIGAIGLGTNLGEDLRKNLSDARAQIGKIPHTRICKLSSIHRTEPLLLADQPDFLNQCLLIETWLHPEEFLKHTRAIERDLGPAKSIPNGPRVMDIDLLMFDNFTMRSLQLTLPHPALDSRRFLIEELGELGIKIWPKNEAIMQQRCEILPAPGDQLEIQGISPGCRIFSHPIESTAQKFSPMATFNFRITAEDPTGARCGVLSTPHGILETPNFIFCGTRGSIKGLTIEQVRAAGAQIILANTYHLHIQPGEKIVENLGGLHRMMGWDGPMLTDSGGFQVFSLRYGGVVQEIKSCRSLPGQKSLIRVTEEGALFRSYCDGSLRMLTPEKSIQIQRSLGADIILPLDECTPAHLGRTELEKSTGRSHRWEKRSLEEFLRTDTGTQALYGIVQGGTDEALRRERCAFVRDGAFFGQAIGGSLGVNRSQMMDVISMVGEMNHPTKPTHLLGIGGVGDILHGVRCGMDTFDCVHPTRLARHGGALVPLEVGDGLDHINLKNAKYTHDSAPIDENCTCYACRTASRGYIHHLLKSGELLGGQLLTIHNITFMVRLMETIRAAIRGGTLCQLLRNGVSRLAFYSHG